MKGPVKSSTNYDTNMHMHKRKVLRVRKISPKRRETDRTIPRPHIGSGIVYVPTIKTEKTS